MPNRSAIRSCGAKDPVTPARVATGYDAQITAAVKAKLAAEKLTTLTRVGVETNLRTVYLTGVVDSEATRQRAAEIAWSVKHVNGVVNHLTVQQKG